MDYEMDIEAAGPQVTVREVRTVSLCFYLNQKLTST
jgi:hypothetical protein